MQTATESSNEKAVVETEDVPTTQTRRQPDDATNAKICPPADCEMGNGALSSL